MLYSSLYQSIRLVLFGALGLSSLAANATLNDADQQIQTSDTDSSVFTNATALDTADSESAVSNDNTFDSTFDNSTFDNST
ncbi:MAG: hypothetical protein ACTHZF_02740, partial [Psychrobacter sp.]